MTTYARFHAGCDVQLRKFRGKWHCIHCVQNDGCTQAFDKPPYNHMVHHSRKGDDVPRWLLERLKREKEGKLWPQ